MHETRFARGPARIVVLAAVALAGLLFAGAVNQRPVTSTALVPNASAPIQSVVSFKTAFTEHLNEAIRLAPGAKETTIFNTKLVKDVMDKTLVKTTDARAQSLSQAELTNLRELINRRLDATIAQKLRNEPGIAKLGDGTVNQDFFTGRLLPAPAPRFDVSPVSPDKLGPNRSSNPADFKPPGNL